MEFRRHPLLRYYGISNWPPLWSSISPARLGAVVSGEVGILKKCTANSSAGICFLFIEHDGESYVGALLLADEGACDRICRILNQNLGRTIAEIGALDLQPSRISDKQTESR